MTREELASALEMLPVNDPDWRWDLPLVDIVAAARKQLALMPEKDGVYPPATVRKIAKALEQITVSGEIWAVAVLDALGETE